MPPSSDPPCQAEACAIQDCLTKMGFQESRCLGAIDALYVCCSKLPGGGKSTACPKPEVVQRKLREMEARSRA